MAAGTAYAKRYAGGFIDGSGGGTPIDSVFLNAVEAALLQLIAAAPSADAQVMQWDNANTRYGPALILNKNVDPAAAIAKSKLDLTGANGIVNADVAGAAAIAYSKLNLANSIVNGDLAGSVAASKISGGVAMQLICSSVAGGAVASFDTNTILGGNISSAYNHLRVVVRGRGDTAATNTITQMRLNNDSGANYQDEREENSSATVVVAAEGLAATFNIVGRIAASTATAGHAGMSIIDIPMYNDTVFQKLNTYLSIMSIGTATANKTVDVGGGAWHSTAAVTRITVFPNAGNFIAGSAFYLYGIL